MMSEFRAHLDRLKGSISCQKVAEQLGLTRLAGMPRAIECPFCGGSAWCREDGLGFRCTVLDCGKTGDQLHLIMNERRMDFANAAVELERMAAEAACSAGDQTAKLL